MGLGISEQLSRWSSGWGLESVSSSVGGAVGGAWNQ